MGLTDLSGWLEVTCVRHGRCPSTMNNSSHVPSLQQPAPGSLWGTTALRLPESTLPTTGAPRVLKSLGLLGKPLSWECGVQRWTRPSSLVLDRDTLRCDWHWPQSSLWNSAKREPSLSGTLFHGPFPAWAYFPGLYWLFLGAFPIETLAGKGSLLLKGFASEEPLGCKCQRLSSNSTIHCVNCIQESHPPEKMTT